jgi:hypothetical protein
MWNRSADVTRSSAPHGATATTSACAACGPSPARGRGAVLPTSSSALRAGDLPSIARACARCDKTDAQKPVQTSRHFGGLQRRKLVQLGATESNHRRPKCSMIPIPILVLVHNELSHDGWRDPTWLTSGHERRRWCQNLATTNPRRAPRDIRDATERFRDVSLRAAVYTLCGRGSPCVQSGIRTCRTTRSIEAR